MEIILLIIGLLIGFVIGFLYMKNHKPAVVEQDIHAHPVTIELRKSAERLTIDIKLEREEKEKHIRSLAASEQQVISMKDKLDSQVKEVQELRTQFHLEFQNLANRIFEEKSEKFTQHNKEQMDTVLNPFKEKLKDFETKVEKVYNDENKERINLKAEIRLLSEMNKQLSTDANNLATALKGSNKSQGNWGELILEKILERSGLQRGVEYDVQHSSSNIDDRTIRPDAVIHLPDGKHLVVDSKVSLIAFNSMIAADTDEDRLRYQRAHIESVRSHVKQLSDKKYHTAEGFVTPDFVLLFMPTEAGFSIALQGDPEMYNYAWDKQIIMVSPTTLLATLRTVANIWKQEKRTRNVEAIAEEGGKLYDKFVGFVEDLVSMGKSMKKSQTDYEEVMKKLTTGTGNLVNRAEKMRQLGAKTNKEINPRILERAEGEGNS